MSDNTEAEIAQLRTKNAQLRTVANASKDLLAYVRAKYGLYDKPFDCPYMRAIDAAIAALKEHSWLP